MDTDDLEPDLMADSFCMIQCTVVQSGIVTSLVVEKFTSANAWEFVDPNVLEEMEKGIETPGSTKEPDGS